MALADFASGAQNALQQMMARRLEQARLDEHRRATEERERQAREELRQRTDYQTAQLETLRDQREALADQRRQQAAHTLTQDLAPGDVLDAPSAETLRAGHLGGLVESQEATLPSRATTGFLRTGSAGVDARPQFSGGALRTISQPGHEARDVFRGTGTQRRTAQQRQELAAFIEQLPEGPARTALEYQLRTGDNPPAGLFPREPAESYQAIPLYDEDGRSTGAMSFNQRTGEARPVDLPEGAGIRAGAGRRGALPPRVQQFLLDLRAQHPDDYAAAHAAFSRVMASAPDEQFDRLAAATALRSLYAQPTGANEFAGLDLSGLASRELGRGAPPEGVAGQSQPPGGQTMTRAELQAVAQQMGISESQAAAQARARGFQIQ